VHQVSRSPMIAIDAKAVAQALAASRARPPRTGSGIPAAVTPHAVGLSPAGVRPIGCEIIG
jgi:hypothetical protein